MRAVLVGVVGAVLAVGGAEAKKAEHPVEPTKLCPLMQRTFVLQRSEGYLADRLTAPEMIGHKLRPIRTAAGHRWYAVELADGSSRYVVNIGTAEHAVPAVGAASFSGMKGKGVNWRSAGAPDDDLIDADISSGPLAGMNIGKGICP